MDHMVVHDNEWLELFYQFKGVEGWSEHRLGHVFSWMLEGTTGKAEAANQLSENEASRYRSSWIVSSDVQTVVLAELSRSRGLESFDMSVNAQVLGKNSFDSGDRLVQVFSNCPLYLSQKPKCNIDRSPDASSIQPVSEPSCQLKSQSNFPGHEFVSSCAEREPSRESSGKLAWSHPSIVPSEDGTSEPTPAGRSSGGSSPGGSSRTRWGTSATSTIPMLPTSCELSEQGPESIRLVEALQSVQDQVELPGVWAKQPPPQTHRGGKKKNVTQETYVSTGPPITMGPLEAQGSSVSTLGPTMLDIQNVLTEQANHMAQSTASSMSQAMGPVMEAIHQMSNSQQALQQMVMNQQQLLNHLMTAPQSGRVPEAIPISSDQEEEMEEFEEGWVQPHP